MSYKWKPYQHVYPDPIGNALRDLGRPPPRIELKTIPIGPFKIKPLGDQIREGGKLKDRFEPERPPLHFEPMRIRLPIRPPPPVYELKPGEEYAAHSLRRYSVGLV